MNTGLKLLAFASAAILVSAGALAQSAKDIRGAAAVVALDSEPAPRLVVDPPLPGPLSKGHVFIQYRTEHLRIVPVFGNNALDVSPRIGHLHVTVDDAPWHWADASGEPIILVGMKPGPHSVLIELADANHKVMTSKTVTFNVPSPAAPTSSHH